MGGIVAPWWLGLALAVSMTADAGQEASSGASLAPLPLRAPSPPAELIRVEQSAQSSRFATDFGGLSGEVGKLLRQASLSIGNDDEFHRLPDEIEPRGVLKRNARLFPSVDRSHKGDPLVGLRPGFESRLRAPHGLASLSAGEMLFHHDENLPAASFAVAEDETDAAMSGASFEPWPNGESPATAHSIAGASPGQTGSTATMPPAAANERLMQGATPAVRRAMALGSTTPAPADSTPVEVVVLPGEPWRASRRGNTIASPKPFTLKLAANPVRARRQLRKSF